MSTAFESVSELQARNRNLRISIAKCVIQLNKPLESTYTISEIKSLFYFCERDIKYSLRHFFKTTGEHQYGFHAEMCRFLEKTILAHQKAVPLLEEATAIFIKTFGRFYEQCQVDSFQYFNPNQLCSIYEKIHGIIPILHWGQLPILNKYLMINSGIIPEKDVIGFYDHYDMMSALLKDIRGEGEVMNTRGDETLNKEMEFSVYTRRWGHNSHYRVRRTVDGWTVGHISINGKCDKDGTGALFNNLDHDSVFYPEDGVKYAMRELWEQADEGELSFQELQDRLQQIADWISSVERVVGKGQPKWVNYY